MSPTAQPVSPRPPLTRRRPSAGITALGLTTRHRGGTVALDHVSLAIEPGRLTAIVGPSGAGKTTLLSALAGVAPAQQGVVTFTDGGTTSGIGFVPQDDILHGELPLRRTLRYAAAVRMAAPPTVIDAAVDDALDTLGLSDHGAVQVRSLSGGQRKRANIACEILTGPDVCFLDEPTSGLDPAAAAGLVDCMHRMCAAGSTVVFTTHSVADIERTDRVVVLAAGGRLAAAGTPAEVLDRLGERTFTGMYERLTELHPEPVSQPAAVPSRPTTSTRPRTPAVRRPGAWAQWRTLTMRAAEILLRNRLTVAILLGSPAAVIVMFAVLFRPGGLDPGAASSSSAVQVAYWLAFAGFFFGLTFGLLQVCTEVSVLQRERFVGMRVGSYVASKLALLAPVLLLVNVTMLVVLRALDRIPTLSAGSYVALGTTMTLSAVAALCLGLLASAAVTSTAQAALALPMLCFPAVLFSGAMVPVPVMASAGKAIAAVMSDRWAFEAIAGHLHVAALAGPASPYAGLGASSTSTYWALLAAFTVVTGCGAYAATRHRASQRTR